jgi:RNA polymerase sigma-70 factor (ECF subfamily)
MRKAEPSDAELLATGDAADFGCFYDRHLVALTAFVGSRTPEPEAIFDFVAETFARALERREQYDPDRGAAVAWLVGIARHLMIDAARRGQIEASSRVRLGMAAVALDDDQLALIAERGRLDLRAALSGMPSEQREAVLRRVVLDQSYAGMADGLRCSEQVVRKRVSRGLAALRTSVGGQP